MIRIPSRRPAARDHSPRRRGRRTGLVVVLLVLALVAGMLVASMLGEYVLTPSRILSLLLHPDDPANAMAGTVFYHVRLVRILGAAEVGAALSVAGALMQSVFRNPLVSPDILGASGGAGLGAALGLLLGASTLVVQAMSFTGGLLAVLLALGVARTIAGRGQDVLTLVLTGMVVSSLCQALISLVKYVGDPENKLPQITFWLLGGLSSIRLLDVEVLTVALLVSLVPLLLLRWQLNLLAFGDDQATTMGVDVRRLRLLAIVTATLLTGVSVAVAGIVGWVGLIIPHLARVLVGANTRDVLVTSALLGAIFVLVVDTLARTVTGMELPLGVLTATIGAPVFLYLMVTGRRRQWS